MMHLPTQVHVCLFVCDVPVFRHCPVGPACHSFVPISVSHFMAPISSNGPSGEPHDVRCVSGGEHVTLSVSPNSGHVIFIVVECSASSCKQLHLGYRPPGRVISNLTRSQHRHLVYLIARVLSAYYRYYSYFGGFVFVHPLCKNKAAPRMHRAVHAKSLLHCFLWLSV